MILTLEQRLNLVLMIGMLDCKTNAETRLSWKLLDKLELDALERDLVSLQVVIGPDGQESFRWNVLLSREEFKDIKLTEWEAKRITTVLDEFPKKPAYRPWLEPLFIQLGVQEDDTSSSVDTTLTSVTR